jgi:hypothetical protein
MIGHPISGLPEIGHYQLQASRPSLTCAAVALRGSALRAAHLSATDDMNVRYRGWLMKVSL